MVQSSVSLSGLFHLKNKSADLFSQTAVEVHFKILRSSDLFHFAWLRASSCWIIWNIWFPTDGCVICRLRWRGDLVQGRLGDPPLGRLGHQHADTNVVDGKWRLLINNTALYSLGLQHHFRLLTSRVKHYWLLGEGGGHYLSVQRDIFRPPSLNYPQSFVLIFCANVPVTFFYFTLCILTLKIQDKFPIFLLLH